MNADDILTRTFAEHEDLAPAADDVLAELGERLEGQRRRRTTRALSVLAAAAVATVAVGVAVVSGDGGHPDAPAAGSGATVSSSSSSSAPASSGWTPATPFLVTIAPGWLPGTTVRQVAASAGSMSQARDYLVTDGHANLDLELRLGRDRTFPNRQQGVAATHTTVNGRRAVEYAKPGRYEAIFTTDDGRLAAVALKPHLPSANLSDYSTGAMIRQGRHIARTMRFDVQEAIGVAAQLTYLPDGVVINGVQSLDNGLGGTTYALHGPGGTNHAQVMIGGAGSGAASNIGKPAQPVQGHRARVAHSPSGYELVVYGMRPGVTVSLSGGDTVPTLAQLYRVANGIDFTG